MSFESLPKEIQTIIFSMVPQAYWVFINEVCKGWHQILKKDFQIYKKNDFGSQFKILFNEQKCLDYLIDKKYIVNIPSPLDIFYCAIKIGYIKLLQVIVDQHPYLKNEVCTSAAFLGKFNVLKWAWKKNYYMDKSVCSEAAFSNHSEIVKWAYKKGCQLDEETIEWGVKKDNLELVKWCVENGCPYKKSKILEIAQDKNNMEMISYIEKLTWSWNDIASYFLPF
jgi:hypothetical protein